MDIPEDPKTLESDGAKMLDECEKAMAEKPDVQEYASNDESDPRTASSSIQTPPSPPRRPLTRSQTGTVSKRRPRADSDVEVDSKKRAAAPRKRQKTSASPSQPSVAFHSGSPSTSSQPPPDQSSPEAIGASHGSSSPSPKLTFYHASPASEDQNESRVPRSRASLPTPIPNLTKKSRGRRVPTKESTSTDPDQRESRLYVCTVEGCGKCFNRGEHLKRHIRSIHTHEKPFKCTYLHCEKFFNRHDNLLQHLKVHRDPPATPQPLSAPLRSPGVHYSFTEDRSRSYSPADEPDSPIPPTQPRTIYSHIPPPTYNVYSRPIAYVPTSEPMTLMTNMAISSLRTEVSSLRTELPNSPINTQPA